MSKTRPKSQTMRKEATSPPEPFRPAGSKVVALSLSTVRLRRHVRRQVGDGLD